MSQQEMMTSAIPTGLAGRSVFAQDNLLPKYGPEDGVMRTAISDEVGDRIDSIKHELENVSRSLALIGFMGLLIAVSLIGIFAKLMGWLL